jgi:hypothetical protein
VPSSSDIWIKVPNPFWGVDTVGFSVRYPAPPESGPLPDIPIFVEGDAELMASLGRRLQLFPERGRFVDCAALGEAYDWTTPINLSDEVIMMAFRDRSLRLEEPDPAQALLQRLSNQLVPLPFPFLRDCVRIARLRLTSPISVRLSSGREGEIDLRLPLGDIVSGNGELSLAQL